MRIAVGSDHEGLPHKDAIVDALQSDGHAVLDLGTFSEDPVDFPDFARAVANALRNRFVDTGVLLCTSGSGGAMAANKLRGIRAAAVDDAESAERSRREDDANIICLGARRLDPEAAIALTRTFLETPFSNDERHVRRVAKIADIESGIQRDRDAAVRLKPAAGDAPAARAVPDASPPASKPASPPPPTGPSGPAGQPARPTAASGPRSQPAPSERSERIASAADLVGPRLAPSRPARPDSGRAATATAPVATAPSPSLDDLVQEAVLAVGEDPAVPAAPEAVLPEHGSTEVLVDEPLAASAALEALKHLESIDFGERVWLKDASLWSDSPEVQALIRNRLGWLTSPTLMREYVADLKGFATEIRRLGFSNVLLLGTGGSSLAADVMSRIFGVKVGFPDLVVLDSADPATVKAAVARVQLARTLFIVSSKSGTTADISALYRFFRGQADQGKLPKPGQHFIAITDPGTPLEKLAKDGSFRRTFLNHPSIGGRFSALSFFGLVPAALMGVDVDTLLERAGQMVAACGDAVPVRENPALVLGAMLAGAVQHGRDKITLLLSERIQPLGAWIEQLLATSTGKDGKGLVPIVGEPLGPHTAYGADRAFVSLALADEPPDPVLAAHEAAGHPVHRITLRDLHDLGAEFFRWELAVAAVGSLLGVNPFDEPALEAAKDAVENVLAGYRRSKRLPEPPADADAEGVQLSGSVAGKPASLMDGIRQFLHQVKSGDYVALVAYVRPDEAADSALQALRTLVRDRLGVATTLGYGPRALHSTGQLHRAGPPGVAVLQLVIDDRDDVGIPGEAYGLATLRAAQALADLDSLRKAGRRVIRLHAPGRAPAAIDKLTGLISTALA
jgi:RpiB/LacA/LacB family sugar-phosphate isomerase